MAGGLGEVERNVLAVLRRTNQERRWSTATLAAALDGRYSYASIRRALKSLQRRGQLPVTSYGRQIHAVTDGPGR